MTHPSSIGGIFSKPFPEQVAFFRNKLGNLIPTQRWDDIEGAAHDQAFMVAGAVKADLLTDLAAAVDKGIAEGRGLEEFRRDFRSIVAKNGWTGWTGEGSVKGEAWRTGVIFRTNAYTSYAAGRFAQLRAGNFAFWVYRHGGSLEPRVQHLSWDGLVLVPDHAFWITHYPPSDWGCSCYAVGASSESAAKRLGGNLAKKLPADWQQRDPKTGAPVGIGRGWDYAPGASVAETINAMVAKIGVWDYRVGKAFMETLPADRRDALSKAYRELPSTADDARRYAQNVWDDVEPKHANRTLGMVDADQAQSIGGQSALFDFSLTPQELAHIRKEHGNNAIERSRGQRAVTPDDFAAIPGLLNSGEKPRQVGFSDGHKLPVFEIAVQQGNETYVTRWEYWSKRRTMSLLSFFVRTGERT